MLLSKNPVQIHIDSYIIEWPLVRLEGHAISAVAPIKSIKATATPRLKGYTVRVSAADFVVVGNYSNLPSGKGVVIQIDATDGKRNVGREFFAFKVPASMRRIKEMTGQ